MDLLLLEGGSNVERIFSEDSGASFVAGPAEDAGLDRPVASVGALVELRAFQAKCIGNDMSWKGSRAFHFFCSLQGSGVRIDPVVFGKWWGTSLKQLRANVGCVSEVGLGSSEAVAAVSWIPFCRLYDAIFHGAVIVPAAGVGIRVKRHFDVVLAACSSLVGNWLDVERDSAGSAVAASLQVLDGQLVRILGVCGVTGASCWGLRQRLDVWTLKLHCVDS